MEELHDAIEDAQYVSAISNVSEGPRPVLHWDIPNEEQLIEWKEKVRLRDGEDFAFTPEWYLSSPIGFFLFSQFLKNIHNDYIRINFIEYVIKYRKLIGKQRLRYASKISSSYLTPQSESNLPKKEIKLEDHEMKIVANRIPSEKIDKLCSETIHASNEECCLGLCGSYLEQVIENIKSSQISATNLDSSIHNGNEDKNTREKRLSLLYVEMYPNDLFDNLEIVVIECLKKQYWNEFLESNEHERSLNFLWYQDRLVVREDFLEMRVLGRGGFGVVIACKKGTSGKLYAMKVMSKKRIKLKKAEQLALNERNTLAAVNSPFVINLKYSFHCKNDIYLILDLMTGGDLSFHLSQTGVFPKKNAMYYAARIMLGLQAMHDQDFVYRDLKPENCLLDENGRVRITDLGLATKIKPTLQGAAGTRGYWAPEMLRRDLNGKRISYGHAVDWFSFGCLLAEFISGKSPFRSEAALNFGLRKGKVSKEKAIDNATLEMDPILDPNLFDEDATDICIRLLDKNPLTRLGANGCKEIKSHPWFQELDWDLVMTDRMNPPFKPLKDVNAASQSEIGTFKEDKEYHDCIIEERDHKIYNTWDWTNPVAYTAEVIEFLICEREMGRLLLPAQSHTSCCCVIS